MALTNVANFEVAIGSQANLQFVFAQPGGGVYDISGLTWAFRVRTSPHDTTATPLIQVTQTVNTQGVIAVNVPAATLTLTLYPAATQTLAERAYAWSLWSNPGTTSAQQWVGGTFQLDAVVQP